MRWTGWDNHDGRFTTFDTDRIAELVEKYRTAETRKEQREIEIVEEAVNG